MPTLYLVRHAIAEERDAQRWPDDDLRPLTPRGIRRFERAAEGLGTLLPAPARLLTSPLVRATETARVLATHARWPDPIEVFALGNAGIEAQVVELGRHARGATRPIAVVGHQPGLGRLASWLLAGEQGAIEFDWRKGGVAVLTGRAVEAGGARLEGFHTPRSLRLGARTDGAT